MQSAPYLVDLVDLCPTVSHGICCFLPCGLNASGDSNMRILQKGDIIQLERKGYFIVDEPLTKPGKPIVLFTIPDGRERKGPFPGATPSVKK